MLESAQPVVEDVDDPDEVSQCVSIDIPVEGSPDAASAAVHPEALVDLEGKMAALLAAHASETHTKFLAQSQSHRELPHHRK